MCACHCNPLDFCSVVAKYMYYHYERLFYRSDPVQSHVRYTF
eukprot:UN12340